MAEAMAASLSQISSRYRIVGPPGVAAARCPARSVTFKAARFRQWGILSSRKLRQAVKRQDRSVVRQQHEPETPRLSHQKPIERIVMVPCQIARIPASRGTSLKPLAPIAAEAEPRTLNLPSRPQPGARRAVLRDYDRLAGRGPIHQHG